MDDLMKFRNFFGSIDFLDLVFILKYLRIRLQIYSRFWQFNVIVEAADSICQMYEYLRVDKNYEACA
jgi:hypothetical protein